MLMNKINRTALVGKLSRHCLVAIDGGMLKRRVAAVLRRKREACVLLFALLSLTHTKTRYLVSIGTTWKVGRMTSFAAHEYNIKSRISQPHKMMSRGCIIVQNTTKQLQRK